MTTGRPREDVTPLLASAQRNSSCFCFLWHPQRYLKTTSGWVLCVLMFFDCARSAPSTWCFNESFLTVLHGKSFHYYVKLALFKVIAVHSLLFTWNLTSRTKVRHQLSNLPQCVCLQSLWHACNKKNLWPGVSFPAVPYKERSKWRKAQRWQVKWFSFPPADIFKNKKKSPFYQL